MCVYALGVWWVSVFAQGWICLCGGSVAICDPCAGSVGCLGVCTHVAQMCVFCVLCTFISYGSVWGI